MNDALVFCELDEGELFNFRCVLLSFQAVSEFNINLIKFELVTLGGGNDDTRLTNVLGCKQVELPIKDLALLLWVSYKDVRMWDLVKARFD